MCRQSPLLAVTDHCDTTRAITREARYIKLIGLYLFYDNSMTIRKISICRFERKKIMKTIKFPEDFVKRPHPNFGSSSYMYERYKNAFQYCYPNFEENKISIIGGSDMFYCDGTDNSFEMYDFREDEPQGYLTADQINEHLQKNPFEDK